MKSIVQGTQDRLNAGMAGFSWDHIVTHGTRDTLARKTQTFQKEGRMKEKFLLLFFSWLFARIIISSM